MHDYEILIRNNKRTSLAYIEVVECDDGAAIRAARRFAGDRPVEVWRDSDCIYRSDAPRALRPAA